MPPDDPAAALEGVQLAFGKHKGSNIALMVELLAAGLTGSPFSSEARDAEPAKGHHTCETNAGHAD